MQPASPGVAHPLRSGRAWRFDLWVQWFFDAVKGMQSRKGEVSGGIDEKKCNCTVSCNKLATKQAQNRASSVCVGRYRIHCSSKIHVLDNRYTDKSLIENENSYRQKIKNYWKTIKSTQRGSDQASTNHPALHSDLQDDNTQIHTFTPWKHPNTTTDLLATGAVGLDWPFTPTDLKAGTVIGYYSLWMGPGVAAQCSLLSYRDLCRRPAAEKLNFVQLHNGRDNQTRANRACFNAAEIKAQRLLRNQKAN